MMNKELNKESNKTDEESVSDICAFIFAFLIFGYIFISLFFAILLLIYNFILVPLAKSFLLQDVSAHNYFVQQINSLNTSLSEKTYILNNENNKYQQDIQTLQSYTPLPTNQLIEAELILMVPPAILLGLIYYPSKKENDDE